MQTFIKILRTVIAASALSVPVTPSGLCASSFGNDAVFLQKHTRILLLSDLEGRVKVAVAPEWQGRVMTSTAGGDAGASFGWINRELIASGKLQPHINIFGGEDRFWLGPEGGQFSIFFSNGAKFELSDWYTPAAIDTMAYEVVKQTSSSASFQARFVVTNYTGTRFDVKLDRDVVLLSPEATASKLGMEPGRGLSVVAYETINKITNAGKRPWEKATGLLSIWILGMYNSSPATTIVVPIKSGPESQFGIKVTADYFGDIPPERLVVKDDVVFFSGDGNFRSKIGINPKRSKGVLGSYDATNRVLTIVQFTQPEGVTDYVNSLWKIQDNPFEGDASNSYNDGPPAAGVKQLGSFYELESSSPAAALSPGASLTHVQRTIHLTGAKESLDAVAQAVLGKSLQAIESGLKAK